jgi:hypothetical protein
MLSKIQELSGNSPHLIQYFASRLVDLLITQRSDTLRPHHIDEVLNGFEAASYFMSPFRDVRDPRARLVAVAALSTREDRLSLRTLQEKVSTLGLILDPQQLWNICLELAVLNILVWDNGLFRIANKGLRHHAAQSGFLELTLHKALDELTKAEEH